MISGCPSFIQVTLVAGEPVEVQVRVDDMDSWVNLRFVMLGGAACVGKNTTSNSSLTIEVA